MATVNNTEIWLGEVSRFLIQDSNFYSGAKDHSAYVSSNGAVNIPQMLTRPTVGTYIKGTTSLPLVPDAATSDILSYNTMMKYAGPIYGDAVDMAQYNFNILQESAINISKVFIEEKQKQFAYDWAVTATASIGSTTGSGRTNRYGNATAKGLIDADFLKANLYLTLQGVPANGRRAILSPTMMNDLLAESKISSISMPMTEDAIKRGVIMMYRGFEIYQSNYTPAFSTAGAKKAIGAAEVNTDKESAIFFHPDYVSYAASGLEMLSGDGSLYLTNATYTFKMWIGSSVLTKAVNNKVLGVYTVIEG